MNTISRLTLSLAIGMASLQFIGAKSFSFNDNQKKDYVPFNFCNDPELKNYVNNLFLFDFTYKYTPNTTANSIITPIIQSKESSLSREYKRVEFGGITYYKRYNGDQNLYYTLENGKIHEIYKLVKNVTTTAYTWVDGVGDPAAGDPTKTSINKDAKTTYGFASCYKDFPLGTKIHVPGYGIHTVDDGCGKARKLYRSQKRVSFSEREKILDLRIPNKKGNTWRSDQEIVRIALRHGVKEDREVLVRIQSFDDI